MMGGTGATLAGWAWEADTASARAVRAALAPAAAVYGAVVGLRNRLYDGGWLGATRVGARVISVGNLVVGGTGKTPAALWLAEECTKRGRRVALVARGYRKRRRGVVVVSDGTRVLVRPEEGGDEAVMLAHRFGGPVVTGERRAEAAAEAVRRFGVDTIVLDDGFQHRALARDADLVLVRGDPSAHGVLPSGPLREPVRALARATAVLALGDLDFPPSPPGVPRGVRVFRGRTAPTSVVRAHGGAWREGPLSELAGRDVVAVAGVARPERLAGMLAALGACVVRTETFPDHHAYGTRDLARLRATGGCLVTTEKDLVKLAGRLDGIDLVALRLGVEVERGAALVDLLLGDAAVDFAGV
ncbi:MAG: tetraacyldisaccharide 4'-kinase [Candidatus Binatia bacterium]